MKKFTVRDFIAYNNPCFSCGNQINFKIGFVNTEKDEVSYLPKPNVTPEYTEVDLVINWSSSLKLYIFHKTNKFLTNSTEGLTNYLSRHKLFLHSTCDRCYTEVTSKCMIFNFEKGVVAATELSSERLMVSDKNFIYQINSFFLVGKSNLTVERLDKVKPLSPFIMDLPLLPKSKFKNKQHFLEKMKIYITFS